MRTFTDRYPYVGPIFWILTAQYFISQVVVAAAWPAPYSWLLNTISDLGNTACGLYSGRYVCSPMHATMNMSFIALGVAMLVGSGLIYQEFREKPGTALGFGGMALAGLGALLVGLFPENTVSALHFTGALLVFLVGNLALVAFGKYLDITKGLRSYTLLSGVLTLVALSLFLTKHYLGLGPGGMERLVAYPQTIWLIVFGGYISMNHYRRRSRRPQGGKQI